MIEIVYWLAAGLLAIAALLALLRVSFGPSTLDRAVAIDLITAVIIGMTALVIVWWKREDLLVLLIVFALTGFFSSVTIARFADREDRAAKRILSHEEAERLERIQREKDARDAALEKKGLVTEEFSVPKDDELGGTL